MPLKPAGVIFVNDDLTDNVKSHLIRQLFISETIDGYEFDDRIAANPEYINLIKQLDLRIMVVRPFTELENRTNADLAIFVSHGLAAVLDNNFGPPGLTIEVLNITWGNLCFFGT